MHDNILSSRNNENNNGNDDNAYYYTCMSFIDQLILQLWIKGRWVLGEFLSVIACEVLDQSAGSFIWHYPCQKYHNIIYIYILVGCPVLRKLWGSEWTLNQIQQGHAVTCDHRPSVLYYTNYPDIPCDEYLGKFSLFSFHLLQYWMLLWFLHITFTWVLDDQEGWMYERV